jgi:hypothetical protein
VSVFNPGGTNLVLTSSTASGTLNGDGDVLRIVNNGDQDVYVKSGVGSQSPTNANFYVAPGTTAFLQIGFGDTDVAISTASGGQAVLMRGSLR